MPIVVNTNVQSLNAQRLLGRNTSALSRSFEKLASGFRINRASDDAAGLQISEILRAQIKGSEKAIDNVQDGINVLNTVDGSFETITNNLQRVRELLVQGANDTLSSSQRSAIVSEVRQLVTDITRISKSTQFNGKNLLDGTQTNFTLQVGANAIASTNTINLATATTSNPFGAINGSALGLGSTGSLLVFNSNTSARAGLSRIDAALNTLNTRRAAIGALTNRLEGTSENLSIAVENFSAAESRIRNVDVAKETAVLTRNQILQQASASILSQSNQTPQLALQLLQG